MQTTQTPAELKSQKKIEELRSMYANDTSKNFAKIMLYGEWGTFKTTIATTMPRPILFHTFDPGGEKVKHVQDGIKDGSIIVDRSFQMREMKKSDDVFQKWNTEYNSLKSAGVFDGQIKTLVLDSFTTLQRLVIDASIASNTKNSNISVKMPIKVAQQRDYGVQDSAMEFVIADMLSLPCHVLILAHAEEGTEDKTDINYFRPMIVGKKLRGKIPVLFDEIYITTAQGGRGKVYTQPVGLYHAKSRLGSMFNIQKQYDNKNVGDFNLTRDILVPAGYATADEIPDVK